MSNYLAVTAVFLLLWGTAWSKKDIFNLLTKFAFLGLGFWGLILFLISTGYVIRK